MKIDAITFRLFSQELEEKLVNSRLQKIFQPGDFEFVFRFRIPGDNYFLFLSLEANNQRIHPIPGKYSKSRLPTSYCMLLRKHIEGGKVLYVDQMGSDRILRLDIASYMESEGAIERILIIELTGKTSNLILCDGKERVISAFNRKDPRRDLTTGQQYELPPPPQGINPFLIEEKDFFSLIEAEKNREQPIKELLFSTFTGMTGDFAREIIFHSGIGQGTPMKNMSERQKITLYNSFFNIIKKVKEFDLRPTVYYSKDDENLEGNPTRFAFQDFDIFANIPKEAVGSIGDALQAVFYPTTSDRLFDDMKKEYISVLKKRIKKVARRIKKQELDLKGAEGSVALKKWGELILAYMDSIPKKAREIELDDYYIDPPEKITIKLDPSLSPSDNAQAYFKKYKKAKRGLSIIRKRLRISADEHSDLETALYEVEEAESIDELTDVIESLQFQDILPLTAKPGRKKTDAPLGPRKFEIAPGYVALVGRNSRQNDELTLHIAQKEDLWFHARHIPGSHVVLRIQKPSKPVPDEVIYKTASIAAYYSKGRNSSKVPVDYTPIKNVRKSKGQKAGKVFIVNEKTIFVKPEDMQARTAL
ncbi:MAG: NFACT family protein [Candidatus Eremiobacteraeota bacterium]|nr:NFACT family protein [Candidatus Eremiobacteraeota bacterium]